MRKVIAILLLLIFAMSIPVFADNFNYIYSNECNPIEETVQPTYIAKHPCHGTTSCKYCDKYTTTVKSCGCVFIWRDYHEEYKG